MVRPLIIFNVLSILRTRQTKLEENYTGAAISAGTLVESKGAGQKFEIR
jgi:hypothetical protein